MFVRVVILTLVIPNLYHGVVGMSRRIGWNLRCSIRSLGIFILINATREPHIRLGRLLPLRRAD